MDCKTARLLLHFARPQAPDLEAEEAADLDSHLDRCPDCHRLADGERRFDDQLGRAMRQVEVPAGLQEQLLARLEAERGDWQRRRFARAARRVAAAAAVLLLGWFGWYEVSHRLPPPVDVDRVAADASAAAAEDRRARAAEGLRRLGVDTRLSPHLNYNLLAGPPALAELPGYPGRRVPVLFFVSHGRVARVYVLDGRAVPADAPAAADGTFKAEVIPSEGEPFRFLVVHDGDNWDWLRPPEPPAT